MTAGQRSQRISLQQRSVDDNGDRLGDWEDGFDRWARVVARTRGEVALQARLEGVQPIEVNILRDSQTRGVTSAWRIMWQDVPYNIQSVAMTENRAEFSILAQADQSDA